LTIFATQGFEVFVQQSLKFGQVAVNQDADILSKIYPDTPQKIKLNNEVGMDWVRRNFIKFPMVVGPNFSKDKYVSKLPSKVSGEASPVSQSK
jgi:hypothetical protein